MRFFSFSVFLACLSLLGYMGWHAFDGPGSFENKKKQALEMEYLEKKYEEIKAERERLERKVALLRPKTLDLDLTEEMVRRVLGYVTPHEMILNLPDNQRASSLALVHKKSSENEEELIK